MYIHYTYMSYMLRPDGEIRIAKNLLENENCLC